MPKKPAAKKKPKSPAKRLRTAIGKAIAASLPGAVVVEGLTVSQYDALKAAQRRRSES